MRDELTDTDFDEYELEDWRPDEWDGTYEEDCMDCGMCDECVRRTQAAFEEMEREVRP